MKKYRNVYLLGLISLFADIASQMVYPLIPGLLVNMGIGIFLIGLIEGIAEATASFFKAWLGRLSDQSRRRKAFVILGYGLSALAKPLFAFVGNWGQVLAVRFVDRLGKAGRNPARDALIVASVEKDKKGWAFGIHKSFDRVGSILGPLVAMGILFLSEENIRLVFLWAFLPALIGVLIALTIKEIKPESTSQKILQKKQRPPLEYQLFLICVFVFTLGNSSNAFLILRADELGLSPTLIPLIWALYNLVCALAAPSFGSLSDRIGRKGLILISFIFYAFIYLLFAFVPSSGWLWLLFPLYGIHYGLTKGIFKAYVSDLVPKEKLATYYGNFEMWVGFALVGASILMGLLWEYLGSFWAFVNAASLSLLAFLIFLLGNKWIQKSQKINSPG